MIIILAQNRAAIHDFGSVWTEKYREEWAICGISSITKNETLILGKYASQERATEIIEEMYQRINNQLNLMYKMPRK